MPKGLGQNIVGASAGGRDPSFAANASQRGIFLGSQHMTKQKQIKLGSKKDLEDQLENVENKLRAEMNWFREEIAPLKNKQRELIAKLKEM